MRVDAVFQGGGVLGIGLVGALQVIEDRGYKIQNVAGTSAGAIVASLCAAGYKASEIEKIVHNVDFTRLTDVSGIGRIPVFGLGYNAIKRLGLYDGDALLMLLRKLLSGRNVTTFADLRMEGQTDARYQYRLRVVVSDISRGMWLALPQESIAYGIEPDNMEVALAVRMSVSIPFFFQPIRLPFEGHTSYIVDGGLLSNFPVDLFDTDGVPEWPTFGFRLVNGGELPTIRNLIRGPVSLAKALLATATESNDTRYIETHNFVRSIVIDTQGVSSINFRLTDRQKSNLYTSGQAAAVQFLNTWDWDAYKLLFRTGYRAPSRRDILTEYMTMRKYPQPPAVGEHG